VHQDVTVRGEEISVDLWVRVVNWVATDDGMYIWHVHVTTAEDGWTRIVDLSNR
jgi:hypothetical protein